MPKRRWASFYFGAALVAAFAVLLGVAWAADDEPANTGQGVSTGYKFDRQLAAFRSSISAVDSTGSVSAAANTTEFGALGRINIPVSARFSTASATVTVRLYGYWKNLAGTNTFLGCSDPITLTASSVQDAGSLYAAPTYVFDSFGANYVRLVVVTAPSSGTVNFWVGSY